MIDLFKIGFLSVTLLDVIDIALVSAIIYRLYKFMRGTIAAQIFFGLIIVLFLSFITEAVDLKALGWLLELIRDIWVIAFIILFQPEIRKLLVTLGQNPLLRSFVKRDNSDLADILAESAFELAQHQHGALIIIIKSSGIGGVVETGDVINAKVSKDLLRSIFFPRSPLHDGAVIIKGDMIESVRCTLPLSSVKTIDNVTLGMRHRAGLGISEQADVLSIIVSEETGGISVAEGGKLSRGLSKEALRKYLTSKLRSSKDKNVKGIFEQLFKKK